MFWGPADHDGALLCTYTPADASHINYHVACNTLPTSCAIARVLRCPIVRNIFPDHDTGEADPTPDALEAAAKFIGGRSDLAWIIPHLARCGQEEVTKPGTQLAIITASSNNQLGPL